VRHRVLGEDRSLEKVAAALTSARRRLKEWTVAGNGGAVLKRGLKRAYRKGGEGLAQVLDEPTGENFHEWRKRVKDLGYQLQILRPTGPRLMGELVQQAEDLGVSLGD